MTTEQGTTNGFAIETGKRKSNSEQLVEYFEVKNTPFTVARNGLEWYVLMGKYRLTEDLKTKKIAIENAKKMTWMRIMQVISIMIIDEKNEAALKVPTSLKQP